MNKNCCICGDLIPDERLEALKILEIHPFNFLCLSCSNKTNKIIKGVYGTEDGTLNMILVSGVGEYGIQKNEIDDSPDEELSDEF